MRVMPPRPQSIHYMKQHPTEKQAVMCVLDDGGKDEYAVCIPLDENLNPYPEYYFTTIKVENADSAETYEEPIVFKSHVLREGDDIVIVSLTHTSDDLTLTMQTQVYGQRSLFRAVTEWVHPDFNRMFITLDGDDVVRELKKRGLIAIGADIREYVPKSHAPLCKAHYTIEEVREWVNENLVDPDGVNMPAIDAVKMILADHTPLALGSLKWLSMVLRIHESPDQVIGQGYAFVGSYPGHDFPRAACEFANHYILTGQPLAPSREAHAPEIHMNEEGGIRIKLDVDSLSEKIKAVDTEFFDD